MSLMNMAMDAIIALIMLISQVRIVVTIIAIVIVTADIVITDTATMGIPMDRTIKRGCCSPSS